MADFASTNGQILFVLQKSSGPMTSNAIYRAGSFDYEHTCYNGLAQLSKKGVLHRERVDGLYHYVIAPGADLSDWEDELKELADTGLPPPDPDRRMGVPRAEYEAKSREEKATMKRTRSVFHRETEIREVEETVPAKPLEIPTFLDATPAQLPAPQPEPPAPVVAAPALSVTQTEKPHDKLLSDALEKRDAANREIALIHMMRDITSGDSGALAFILQDYIEFCDHALPCMDNEGEQQLLENREKAVWFRDLLVNADRSVFRRAAYQLLQWAFLNEDSHAGCNDESAQAAMKDAAESRRLAALFGCDSKHGDMPKE